LSHTGRTFFKYSDMAPRVTAFLDGAMDAKKAGLKVSSDDFRSTVFEHTQKWTFGTTPVDTPIHLKRSLGGYSRPLMQFTSYVFRGMGAIADKQFTLGEKVRLATAYFFQAGTGSLPVATVTRPMAIELLTGDDDMTQTDYEKLEEWVGEDKAPLAVLLYSGGWDAMLMAATGDRYQFGDRVSMDVVSSFYNSLIKNQYGATPLQSVLGAIGSTAKNFGTEVDRAMYLYDASYGSQDLADVSSKTMIDVLTGIFTSAKLIEQTAFGLELGKLVDKDNRPLFDANESQIIMELIGIPVAERAEHWMRYEKTKDLSKRRRILLRQMADNKREILSLNDQGEYEKARQLEIENSLYY